MTLSWRRVVIYYSATSFTILKPEQQGLAATDDGDSIRYELSNLNWFYCTLLTFKGWWVVNENLVGGVILLT